MTKRGKRIVCVSFYVVTGIFRLGKRIVSGPDLNFRIIAIVIFRILVTVRALQHFPIIKTLPPLRWYITGTPVPVHMPLADISGVVSVRPKSLTDTLLIRRQRNIIHKHAVGRRVTPGQQNRTGRCANRRGGIGKINRFSGQSIDIRRDRVRITIITRRLGTPLVGQYVD